MTISAPVDAILRGLVLITVLYEKGGRTQIELCRKENDQWVGLLHDQWDRFHLYEQGFIYPCSGAPHIANAVSLMGDFGFMVPPGSKESRNPNYALTELGKCVAKFLLQNGVVTARSKGTTNEQVSGTAWSKVALEISSAFSHTADIVKDGNLTRELRIDGTYQAETTAWLFAYFAESLSWSEKVRDLT